ncbi:uncharacterized protein LOC106635809 [Copidosoma floridanum]|uniref:uncharacterized protein LOC106635809 n=1 Tax=Copidosoma floridanum TaxID=29053 RepID=UPI0006C9DE01|nr:uncharacterized protein LOC106635809 [Copidosoma floridanum]
MFGISMCLNKNLLCFKHCCSKSIFCQEVPEKCPICDQCLTTFLLEPFVVPNPLVNAKDYPCCVVVRPSDGDFLDYNVSDDLHIGVTDSDGNVIEFDGCGLVKNDNTTWKKCAAIPIIPTSWETFWDDVLNDMCNDSTWNASSYNFFEFNCFNFVIAFLNNLKYNNIQFMNKEDMCKICILPKIQSIIKYSSIHKQLIDNNIYIQK